MSPFRASAAFTEEWEHFDFAVEDGVATVTFSRPDKLNALTFDVYADLRDLVTELPHLGDVRVLVLTGEGRGFCSGGDVEEIIGELQGMSAGELLEFTRMSGAVVKAMRDCPIPIVAAVNGVAAGAGAVLALAADLRLLASSAKFSFLFTKVGLAGADMGAAYLLPRLVGLGRATELLLLGGEVDPARATAIGLATRVVPDDELRHTTQELARQLADGPALAYATTKILLTRELDLDLEWGDRDGGARPGAADEERRLPGVLRSLVGGKEPGVDRPVIVNPPDLPEPVGFAHAVVAGRTIHLGGQIGEGATLVEQFDSAAGRIVSAMRAAGAEPDDLVSLVVYTTAIDEYRASTSELGEAWRRHFGRRYPAMALIGVSALMEPDAKVELMGVAALPDG